MGREPLIVGNWKMHGTIEETLKMITELRHKLTPGGPEVAIAPPFTALYSAQVVLQETPIKLAAQDTYWEIDGAFTGAVSPLFLKDVGCSYVIVGHSERREYFGETDETVNRKIRAAQAQELIPIFCLGEMAEQRKAGKTDEALESQLKQGLAGIPMADLKNLVIAYEPVWAIGSGKTATTEEIQGAVHFIRDHLGRNYDGPTANGIRLLYGGSVTPEAARGIAQLKDVDGFLVGGNSLIVDKFVRIIAAGRGN